MSRLLLIDDDVGLCDLLVEYLTREGFTVTAVHNGNDALEHLQTHTYDCILLDVMLPGLNGFELLRRLREDLGTPILMLTARGDEVDRIVGLEMGADDYLSKPCNPRELTARIKAILRRVDKARSGHGLGSYVVGDVELRPASRQAKCAGLKLQLTATEFDMLELLLKNNGKVVSKETFSKQVLGRKMTPFDRSVDMHISNLRHKLGVDAEGEPRITTVRGIGYCYQKQTAHTLINA